MTIAIEIVDAAVTAVRDGTRVAASPGVALLAPGGPLIGELAVAAARLQPVLASDRFWSDLALDSFAGTVEQSMSHADLAYAHLSEIWRASAQAGEDAVFALPGSMRLHQAGLLLGIARRIGIPLAGVVDSAVAACAGLAARPVMLHLDVQLHQAVLTEMDGETVLCRRRVEVAPRAGLKAMYSAWAQLIGEAMVRRTRFDPLHQASSEQQLYERLPEWLALLSDHESVDATVDGEANAFSATVRREQFTLVAEAWYAQIGELVRGIHRVDEPATLVLSSRAALLPALGERLAAQGGMELARLADTAAAMGASARADEIGPGDPPALVTALARTHAAAGRAPRQDRKAPATHAILAGRAHAIDERPLVIGAGDGEGRRISLTAMSEGVSRTHCTLMRQGGRSIMRDHSRYGTFVNGVRVSGETELGAGDRLRVGSPGFVFELVAAE